MEAGLGYSLDPPDSLHSLAEGGSGTMRGGQWAVEMDLGKGQKSVFPTVSKPAPLPPELWEDMLKP